MLESPEPDSYAVVVGEIQILRDQKQTKENINFPQLLMGRRKIHESMKIDVPLVCHSEW